MKHIRFLVLPVLVLVLAAAQAFAQTESVTVVPPAALAVTDQMTTHLVFPAAIQSVDRGSPDILVQQAAPSPNILRVKAASPGFPETNLTVITADGKLYSYLVHYAAHPARLTLQANGTPEGHAVLPAPAGQQADLSHVARLVAGLPVASESRQVARHGMRLQLAGVYVRAGVLYCRLRIRNRSHLSYTTAQLRFYVRDRRRGRRSAFQEQTLPPLYVWGDTAGVAGNEERVLVYALPQRTLATGEYLCIELLEKNGGRHLRLKVPGSSLLRARVLPGTI